MEFPSTKFYMFIDLYWSSCRLYAERPKRTISKFQFFFWLHDHYLVQKKSIKFKTIKTKIIKLGFYFTLTMFGKVETLFTTMIAWQFHLNWKCTVCMAHKCVQHHVQSNRELSVIDLIRSPISLFLFRSNILTIKINYYKDEGELPRQIVKCIKWREFINIK